MRGRRPNYAWVDLTLRARARRLMRHIGRRADGCWEWCGKRFSNGYGQVGLRLVPRKTTYALAHRVMWEIIVGASPGDLMVLHRCDHPWCVRPSHLFLGTAQDNSTDMVQKGRTNPPRGERSCHAKLTADTVRARREAYLRGAGQRALAARFGVSAKQVSVIVNKKQWSHV